MRGLTVLTMERPAILVQRACRCQSCQLSGPFAWLAYVGTAAGREPVDWLCLHCLEFGYGPQEFMARVRRSHRDARFVLFPATSLETEYDGVE